MTERHDSGAARYLSARRRGFHWAGVSHLVAGAAMAVAGFWADQLTLKIMGPAFFVGGLFWVFFARRAGAPDPPGS